MPFNISAQSGAVDPSFSPPFQGFNQVRTVVPLANGKILLGGAFSSLGGTSLRLTRLLNNGNIDPTFTISQWPDEGVHSIAVQPDDKIIIGGVFFYYGSVQRRGIARLQPDGALDNSFVSNTNGEVWTVVLQPDQKIIIGGNFTTYNGVSRNGIARILPTGEIDTSFNPGSGASVIRALLVQPDGRILAGGGFTVFNGASYNRLVRLNSNGSIDTSFHIGTGFDQDIYALAMQSGKILVGGSFYRYNDLQRLNITRLLPDGTNDPAFNFQTWPGDYVYSLLVQPDNKIIAGGRFDSYTGIGVGIFATAHKIVRLDPNGYFDGSFFTGSGANNAVLSLAFQTDGNLIVGGSFTTFSNFNRIFIARLLTNLGPLPVRLLSFTAKAKECEIQAEWKVSEDQLAERYEIETSCNGIDFMLVKSVAATNAARYLVSVGDVCGKSQVIARLKVYHKDGSSFYSHSVSLNMNCKDWSGNYILKPNFTGQDRKITISPKSGLLNGTYNIEIVSENGMKVFSKQVTINQQPELAIQLPGNLSGIYFVKILNRGKDNKSAVLKLIVGK